MIILEESIYKSRIAELSDLFKKSKTVTIEIEA
jgi:hypothetical protein